MQIKFGDVKKAKPCAGGWKEVLDITKANPKDADFMEQTFCLGHLAENFSDYEHSIEWILEHCVPRWKVTYFNLRLWELIKQRNEIPKENQKIAKRTIIELWQYVHLKQNHSCDDITTYSPLHRASMRSTLSRIIAFLYYAVTEPQYASVGLAEKGYLGVDLSDVVKLLKEIK